MLAATPETTACLAAIDGWARTHTLDAYVFGSLVSSPLEFDAERSDADIVVLADAHTVDAASRLATLQRLRPLIEALEGTLLRVLKRTNAAQSIVSVLLITRDEVRRNVHKSGVPGFFSRPVFLRVGAGSSALVPLADAAGAPDEVLSAVQSHRSSYLRCSANGAIQPQSYGGPDTLPKELLRIAAIAHSTDKRIKETGLDAGLGDLITSLASRRHIPAGEACYNAVLRRCNPGKGHTPAIAPDALLYLWEVLIDASQGVNISVDTLEPRPLMVPALGPLCRMAASLAESQPRALLNALAPEVTPDNIAKELLPIVIDACWRLKSPQELLKWATPNMPSASGLLDASSAAILRTVSWAMWERHSREEARDLLNTRLNNVIDPAERARWADQKATFARFSLSADWTAAETDYQQSLALRASTDGLGYAMTLQNLAFLYLERGELEQAYRFMRRTAEHGREGGYDGAGASYLIGTLGMAWLDLLDGHIVKQSRSRELLRQIGRRLKAHRYGAPRDLRLVARALDLVHAHKHGHNWKASEELMRSFWPRLIVEQLLVHEGKSVSVAASEVLAAFGRPLLVPERLPFILQLMRSSGSSDVPVSRAAVSAAATWPISALSQLASQSTLGAIQALELLLRLYDEVCRAIEGVPGQDVKRTSAGLVNTLRARVAAAPQPLADETLRVIAIVEEAIAARNRIVHAATKPGDEEMVVAACALALEEATILRELEWSGMNPLYGTSGGVQFRADSFCHFVDDRVVMTLGDTELVRP